jgi:hypothetical protein
MNSVRTEREHHTSPLQQSAPCRKILWHIKEFYEYEKNNSLAKFDGQVSSASLLDDSDATRLSDTSGRRIGND